MPEIFISHRQWPFPIDDLIVVIRTAGRSCMLAADCPGPSFATKTRRSRSIRS